MGKKEKSAKGFSLKNKYILIIGLVIVALVLLFVFLPKKGPLAGMASGMSPQCEALGNTYDQRCGSDSSGCDEEGYCDDPGVAAECNTIVDDLDLYCD